MRNYPHGHFDPCCPKNPCPVTPIVCPERVVCVNRCFCYEQPVIVPTHVRVINNFFPRVRYYPTQSCSEETVCHQLPGTAPGFGQNIPR